MPKTKLTPKAKLAPAQARLRMKLKPPPLLGSGSAPARAPGQGERLRAKPPIPGQGARNHCKKKKNSKGEGSRFRHWTRWQQKLSAKKELKQAAELARLQDPLALARSHPRYPPLGLRQRLPVGTLRVDPARALRVVLFTLGSQPWGKPLRPDAAARRDRPRQVDEPLAPAARSRTRSPVPSAGLPVQGSAPSQGPADSVEGAAPSHGPGAGSEKGGCETEVQGAQADEHSADESPTVRQSSSSASDAPSFEPDWNSD